MAEADRELIEAGRDAVKALGELEAVLARSAALLDGSVKRLEAGDDIVEILRASFFAPIRARTEAANDELSAARSRFRTLMFAACIARGMSRNEIASAMGVSHQLVSRYLAESLRETD